MYVGLKPNTEIVEGLVEKDEHGFILTNNYMSTVSEGLFIAGDCRAGSIQQISYAVGEGTAAALAVREYLNKH